jgi:hypothetical protein
MDLVTAISAGFTVVGEAKKDSSAKLAGAGFGVSANCLARGWLARNVSIGAGIGASGSLTANARKISTNSSAVATGEPSQE